MDLKRLFYQLTANLRLLLKKHQFSREGTQKTLLRVYNAAGFGLLPSWLSLVFVLVIPPV
jgi:hypothetical protein